MADLTQQHPLYQALSPDWIQCRDTYEGERKIKNKNFRYLPATSGQIADGLEKTTDPGYKAYQAYKTRARYSNFMREAVQTAIGMLHCQPSKINVPAEMENIRSAEGETLDQLLRFINQEQLITGRVALLPDINPRTNSFYVAAYSTERLVNWDQLASRGIQERLVFALLDETGYRRQANTFTWETIRSFRVLLIDENGDYASGLFVDNETYNPSQMVVPSFRGRTFDEIPLVIINSCDLVTKPDEPPLLDLSNLCLTIYRGQADYRQNLFMQGQDTLVIIGGPAEDDEELRTGAGAVIRLPATDGADAKYIGVESEGLAEQREALQNDERRAGSMGAQSLDTVSRERESGTSLHIRIAARTADLNQIAMTGAAGLEQCLKHIATWMGLNPNDVSVEPNMEFGDTRITGQSMVEMQTARNLGYPISARSLHANAFDKGLTKLTFEEEEQRASEEDRSPFARVKENQNGNRDVV